MACCRVLIGGLFNKKEEQNEGDAHPLDATLRRMLSKLQVYHTVSRLTATVRLLTLLLRSTLASCAHSSPLDPLALPCMSHHGDQLQVKHALGTVVAVDLPWRGRAIEVAGCCAGCD